LNEYDLYGYSIVENPLELAGMMASPVANSWAPVVWYGGSAAVALLPEAPEGYYALKMLAMTHPSETIWVMNLARSFLLGGVPTTWPAVAGRAVKTAWNWWKDRD